MRLLCAPLLALLTVPAFAAGDEGFRKHDLERKTPAELAAAMLPPGTGGNFVERRLMPGIYQQANYSAVGLVSTTRQYAKGVCIRDVIYVSLTPVAGISQETLTNDVPMQVDGTRRFFEIALSGDCSSVNSFAYVNSGSEEMAVRLLSYLAELRDAARSGKPLAVAVACRSELTPDPCHRDIREVISNLPVDSARIISKLRGLGEKGWEVSLSEKPLPRPFWKVRLDDDPGLAREVALTWMVPPPF